MHLLKINIGIKYTMRVVPVGDGMCVFVWSMYTDLH